VLLRQLLALRLLEEWSAELVASGYLTSAQRKTLEEAVSHFCRELRPRALSLVDAFDLSDHFLNSALGRSDGEGVKAAWGRLGKRSGGMKEGTLTSRPVGSCVAQETSTRRCTRMRKSQT
jgi:hypothetical protein